MLKVGIIGYGTRLATILGQFAQFERNIEITAIADPNRQAVEQRLRSDGRLFTGRFYLMADEMLASEELDGVMIGTRCSLHAVMASKVLALDIPLFLEKPIATNAADLDMLERAGEGKDQRVVVSFPLRASAILQKVKRLLSSGTIGAVEHVQAINNVPYGGIYYHNWYRDEQETRGLFLQKATHDFDYITYLLDRTPTEVCAMKSKQIFKGDKPAGLKCENCEEYRHCPESPYILRLQKNEDVMGDYCCFARDTGNEDSGSALVRYEGGMHVCYSQNFFARKKAASRGARLFGYDGTLEFDWYTGKIHIFRHDADLVEIYDFEPDAHGHFGGDKVLVESFIGVMAGEGTSIAPLESGILSARLCLKATESSETHTFVKVK